MTPDDGPALDAGMPVVSASGDELGTLSAVLVDEETEEPGFITVQGGGAERLVPFEAVADVEDGNVVLEVEKVDFEKLPRIVPDRDPTDAEIELAYNVIGL